MPAAAAGDRYHGLTVATILTGGNITVRQMREWLAA
jgi:hypothetical protein